MASRATRRAPKVRRVGHWSWLGSWGLFAKLTKAAQQAAHQGQKLARKAE